MSEPGVNTSLEESRMAKRSVSIAGKRPAAMLCDNEVRRAQRQEDRYKSVIGDYTGDVSDITIMNVSFTKGILLGQEEKATKALEKFLKEKHHPKEAYAKMKSRSITSSETFSAAGKKAYETWKAKGRLCITVTTVCGQRITAVLNEEISRRLTDAGVQCVASQEVTRDVLNGMKAYPSDSLRALLRSGTEADVTYLEMQVRKAVTTAFMTAVGAFNPQGDIEIPISLEDGRHE